jgi:hypothetical protein
VGSTYPRCAKTRSKLVAIERIGLDVVLIVYRYYLYGHKARKEIGWEIPTFREVTRINRKDPKLPDSDFSHLWMAGSRVALKWNDTKIADSLSYGPYTCLIPVLVIINPFLFWFRVNTVRIWPKGFLQHETNTIKQLWFIG